MVPSITLGGAVVTGSGRSLGKEIARLLVGRGHLVLVTDIDEATLEPRQPSSESGRSPAPSTSETAAVEAASADLVARAGRLDMWVNHAGVLMTGPPGSRMTQLDV